MTEKESDRFEADLERAARGDREARDRLWQEHGEMLRQCIKQWFSLHWQSQGDGYAISLCGTEILSEAWLRLHNRTAAMTNGRAWFFRCFYTEALRVTVDYWRRNKKHREDRAGAGSEVIRVLDQQQAAFEVDPDVIHDILDELEEIDRDAGLVAKLKVFERCPDEKNPGGVRGLTNREVAELVDYSLRKVEGDWAYGKAFLFRRLGDGEAGSRG